MTAENLDLSLLHPILDRHSKDGRSALLPVLLEAQQVFGHLPQALVEEIGLALRVPFAEIHGVIEFYSMLYPAPMGETIVRICTSPPCSYSGGFDTMEALKENMEGYTTQDGKYTFEENPCLGLCDHAPAALVGDLPTRHIGRDDWHLAPEHASMTQIGGEPRWLTSRCGIVPPTDLNAYEANEGFQGLRTAVLDQDRQQVIETIKRSGLVGRGGAAFPTGLKWEFTNQADDPQRYVVCNADESEPGTFKDRVLMEGDPFAVIEGMLIAGYATGSKKGYLYIRGEYPRAQAIMAEALTRTREAGYLGEAILGTDFAFEIEMRSGAGAYICGEETALFESIEGRRGFPRLKPPFPTTHGLFGKPTAINNVETLCTAAWIMAKGVDAFRSIGTEGSPGSKLFCLSGDVGRPGVYEVPFGTRLGEIIDIAGGADGEIRAILIGGAAGSFADAGKLDVSMSFEGLREVGLQLGSGVVMVVNTARDLRQILRSLAEFFAHESCGKCLPCQLGTQKQLDLIHKTVDGTISESDIETLLDVQFTMTETSICGLGMTAGTAIQSAYELWPEIFGGLTG
jgi:NADH-quinone oxidoreductase subunit F